jgi:hypothetical protein
MIADTKKRLIRLLATDTDLGTPLGRPGTDRLLDPGRVRPLRSTMKRSDLAGWAGYSCCTSDPRFF